jgi:hypothetical protein
MTLRSVSKLMVLSGLATVVLTFWGTAHFVFPFYAHTYPFAWYGLIVFLDGLLWWRWDEGFILARPREFVTLLFWSAVVWFFFEIWNLRLQDWYYVGVPSHELWSHVEAYLDYATVLPGLFLVYRLLCRMKIPRQVKGRLALKNRASKAFPLIGAVMLALPLIWPDYFFPLVWGGLIFLLEPVCAKWGGRSLLKDAESGEWTTVVRLLLAGILCGGYWELCNYWSLEKWVYTVPLFSEGKLFEMPYLGFLGFPPFCVECFVMINAVYLLRDGRHWDPEAPESPKGTRRRHKIVYLVMMVLGLLLSEWSYAKLRVHTVDSRGESIQQILEDISPVEASSLSQKGWRYPREILQNWNEATRVTRQPFRDRIRQRLELVSLVNMGSINARLLESAGICSLQNLRKQKPDELFPRLVRMNQALRLRQTPLVKRRVSGWIGAAKRQSALY